MSKYIIVVVVAAAADVKWHSVDVHVKSFIFGLSLVLAVFLVGFGLFALEHRNINEFPSQRAMRQLVYYFFSSHNFFRLWFWRHKKILRKKGIESNAFA